MRRAPLRRLLPLLLVASAVTTATAEPTSQWKLDLSGGALFPLSEMADTHRIGLVAGGRLGWTSRLGLGLDLSGSYSPLTRVNTASVRFNSHWATASLGPHFTIGRGLVRATVRAGGGGGYERVDASDDTGTRSARTFVPLADASLDLELHVVSGGGLILSAGAVQVYGDRDYRYAWTSGGLMLTF